MLGAGAILVQSIPVWHVQVATIVPLMQVSQFPVLLALMVTDYSDFQMLLSVIRVHLVAFVHRAVFMAHCVYLAPIICNTIQQVHLRVFLVWLEWRVL
jgi:hypothetical protein